MTLTDRGRDLLQANRHERHDRTHEPRQTFHAGFSKPRELTHDTEVYRAYKRADERLRDQGGRVRRRSTVRFDCSISPQSCRVLETFWRRGGSPKE